MPAVSATRAVVKRCAPSRTRTRAAASRTSATSCVERVCRGCFLGEMTGVLRFAMCLPGALTMNTTVHSYSSEQQKMLAGELYDPMDPELVAARTRARDICQTLNATRESQQDERRRLLCELFGKGGDTVWMQPPF